MAGGVRETNNSEIIMVSPNTEIITSPWKSKIHPFLLARDLMHIVTGGLVPPQILTAGMHLHAGMCTLNYCCRAD